MSFQITIIGLNQTGASIGLALGNYKDKVFRVGHDRNPDLMKKCVGLGVVDKSEGNLPQAIAQADLILLCEPYDETLETIPLLIPDLHDNKYVFDIGWNKQVVNRQLAQVAPNFQHGLNILLTTNPRYLPGETEETFEARVDFFEKGCMLVSTSQFTSSEAVDLATTLAGMLKTSMMFCDPVELDGLVSGTQQLPAILAAGFIHTSQNQPGWREARKVTDSGFYSLSHSMDSVHTNDKSGRVFLDNRENLTRWIDNMIAEMENFKSLLADGNEEAIDIWWQSAHQARENVLSQRLNDSWELKEKPDQALPSFGERLGRLVGIKKKQKPD